jgi:hypothetical protein
VEEHQPHIAVVVLHKSLAAAAADTRHMLADNMPADNTAAGNSNHHTMVWRLRRQELPLRRKLHRTLFRHVLLATLWLVRRPMPLQTLPTKRSKQPFS